jgi:hypothetical protein
MSKNLTLWLDLLYLYQKQILVSGIATTAFVLGHLIPLPFLPIRILESTVAERELSVFGLGLWPWTLALVSIEVFGFAFPSIRKNSAGVFGHADPFNWSVIMLAVVFSFFFGISYAKTLSEYNSIFSLGELLPTSITLVCGVVVLITVGRVYEISGFGMGYWTVLSLDSIYRIATAPSGIVEMFSAGSASLSNLYFWSFSLVLTVIMVIWLLKFQSQNMSTNIHALLWPWITAGVLSSLMGRFLVSLQIPEWQYFYEQNYDRIDDIIYGAFVLVSLFFYLRHEQKWLFQIICLVATLIIIILTELPTSLMLDGLTLVMLAVTCGSLLNLYSARIRDVKRVGKLRSAN